MNSSFRVARIPLSLACALSAFAVSAQTREIPRHAPLTAEALQAGASTGAVASPKERRELTRQFVAKWGGYVQRVYRVPVATWAQRMTGTFAKADGENFRRALQRETFEGALAELAGTGQRLTDSRVIDAYAKTSAATGDAKAVAAVAEKTLGSTTGDLVFTPVTPCRILDTRVVGGPIAAGGNRSFLALAANAGVDFTSQGGSNTNCDVADVGASAVAVNVTAVTPSGAGYTTVYPYGTSAPLAASINYTAGAIVNNTVIVRVPNPLTIKDFTIFSYAQSHYVADIVGYFSPPQATQLDCTNSIVGNNSIAANTVTFFNNPACPAGYKATTPYCWTSAAGVYSQGSGFNSNVPSSSTFCAWNNTTASSQTVYGGNVCCRVPGR